VIEFGSSVGRRLLAGADRLDHRFGRLGFAEALRDVLAVEQAGAVGKQPRLDARPGAGRKQHDRDLFRSAFGQRSGDADYLWYFDFDEDGDVDGGDNGQFNR
jgi:hypothetical protein